MASEIITLTPHVLDFELAVEQHQHVVRLDGGGVLRCMSIRDWAAAHMGNM